jgi:stringent starvation protein B
MTQLLPPKKEVALALLERSNVDVYLDPRAKGVVVPPQFRKEPRLILKIGLNMPVPIPDLRLDEESMSCTLSFNRAKFFCVVPWMSVFAMVGDDGRGMVWPDDVPQELAVRVAQEPPPASTRGDDAPAPSSSRGKGKPRLQPEPVREAGEPASSSERGPRSKRPRKKKEDAPARPVLVAVPPPEKSAPRVEKLDDRREAAAEPRPERPARVPSAAPPRPKRELPPYLRVVK